MTSDLIERHLSRLRKGTRTRRPRSQNTIQDRRRILRLADRELPDGLLNASEDEIYAWYDQYPEDGWTRSTYFTALWVLYDDLAQHGEIAFNPMIDLGRPPDGPRIPHPCTDDELAIALTAPRYWQRVVMLASRAGLRCMEICRVTGEDIIDSHLVIRGKGAKYRTVPIDDELAAELRDAGSGHLITNQRGRGIDPQVMTQMQRPVWRHLGLPESFTLHSMRHWYATRLLEAGVDVRVVQELMGHSSLLTTMGYMQVTSGRKTRAAQMLPVVGKIEPDGSRLDLPNAA